jgi:PAS domain S-box-containing protein
MIIERKDRLRLVGIVALVIIFPALVLFNNTAKQRRERFNNKLIQEVLKQSCLHQSNMIASNKELEAKSSAFIIFSDIGQLLGKKKVTEYNDVIYDFYLFNGVKTEDDVDVSLYNHDAKLMIRHGAPNNNSIDQVASYLSKHPNTKSGWIYSRGKIKYCVAMPIFYNDRFSGILTSSSARYNPISSFLEKDSTLFGAFYINRQIRALDSTKNPSISNRRFDIITTENNSIFREYLLKHPDLPRFTTISVNNKSYLMHKTRPLLSPSGLPIGGVLYAKDITTDAENVNSSLMYLAILFVAGFFFILIVAYFFTNAILFKAFNLDKRIEKRLSKMSGKTIDETLIINQVFDSSLAGMRLIDADLNVLKCNSAYNKIFNLPKKTKKQVKCSDIIKCKKCTSEKCFVHKAMKSLDHKIEEAYYKKPNGEEAVVLRSIYPLYGKMGEFIGVIESVIDRGELKQTEEHLQRSKDQFALFMDYLPLGVFIKDNTSRIKYQNTFFKHFFGEDNYGKYPSQIFNKDDAETVLEEDRHVMTGETVVVEANRTDFKGKDHVMLMHKFRFKGVNNEYLIGGIALDITKRKKAEEHLKMLTNAFRVSHVPMIVLDEKGVVKSVNPAFIKTSRVSAIQYMGKHFSEYIDKKRSVDDFEDMWNQLYEKKRWEGKLYFFNQVNEDTKDMNLVINPVLNEGNKINGFIVSEEKQICPDSKDKESVFSKIIESIAPDRFSKFAARSKSLLNNIVSSSDLLINSVPFSDDYADIKQNLSKSAKDLKVIFNDIETGYKLKNNKSKLPFTFGDMGDTISDIMNEMNNGHGNNIRVSFQNNIDVRHTILNEKSDIVVQIWLKLLFNSFTHTTEGFIDSGISITPENDILVYVIDSGAGICTSEQGKVFENRMGVNNDAIVFQELTLGDAKCIIEELGGRLWYNSVLNEGSSFFFSLPSEKIIYDDSINNIDWSEKTVILAEDIHANFMIVDDYLSDTNINLIWAKSGDEVLDMLNNDYDPDLILMDIKMPGTNGIKVSNIIRDMNRRIPVVGHTAYSYDYNNDTAVENGMMELMEKPFNKEDLIKVFRKYLN